MGTEHAVHVGEVLAVVDGKVHVVECVMGRAVEPLISPATSHHVSVVNENGPDLDSNKEGKVEVSLHRA